MSRRYIVVGAGFFGAVCARELTDAGHRVLVLERRAFSDIPAVPIDEEEVAEDAAQSSPENETGMASPRCAGSQTSSQAQSWSSGANWPAPISSIPNFTPFCPAGSKRLKEKAWTSWGTPG